MAKVIGTASDILVAIRDWAKGKFVAKETGKGLSTNDLTATLKSNYDTAYTNSHTHSNKSVLDGITSAKVTAWDGAIPSSQKGVANGVATLGSDGKVLSSQLPSYVDDVLEYANKASFPTTGETGKIYVAKDTNIVYRWSGSAYVEISSSLALGETSSTAYRGDRGKIAYDHSQSSHAPSNAQANVIETVKVNGTALTPSNKAVDISVPTNNNQLTNGAGYITASNSAVTNKVVANSAITGATKCKITYDSKGLVTGGADLTANDIPTITKSKISDFAHTHDDRYYTRTDSDNKYLPKSHGYASNITLYGVTFDGFQDDSWVDVRVQENGGDGDAVIHFETEGNCLLNATYLAENGVWLESKYAPKTHTHDDRYYTETEINTKLNGKSDTGHTHDDRYYTESEVDTKLNGKANTSGTYSGLSVGSATNATNATNLMIDGSAQTLSFMSASEMTDILNL